MATVFLQTVGASLRFRNGLVGRYYVISLTQKIPSLKLRND